MEGVACGGNIPKRVLSNLNCVIIHDPGFNAYSSIIKE